MTLEGPFEEGLLRCSKLSLLSANTRNPSKGPEQGIALNCSKAQDIPALTPRDADLILRLKLGSGKLSCSVGKSDSWLLD